MNCDVGIGIDIVAISSFAGRASHDASIRKVFTPQEISYAFSKQNPAQHLAARFAAKEAVIKAFHNIPARSIHVAAATRIEIINDDRGVPQVRLKPIQMFRSYVVKVSLTHDAEIAAAIAVVWDRQDSSTRPIRHTRRTRSKHLPIK